MKEHVYHWVKFKHSSTLWIARRLEGKDWQGQPMEYWMVCGSEEKIAPEDIEYIGPQVRAGSL